jgi:hypothetical protein
MSDQETRVGGLILENAPAVDLYGLVLLGGYIAAVCLYLLSCWIGRAWKSRKTMLALDRGKFRYAAATGNLPAMVAIKERISYWTVDADLDGFTALHASCVQGQVGAVLWLCQNGADVNAFKQDGWKYTALHYAASQGGLSGFLIVKILIAFGADWKMQTFAGKILFSSR